MMANIKTLFFIKHIFTFINDKIKLKLIRYNKNLQNNLSINIINYQILSGRYIIYETKDKGKEYMCYNDKLIYEGEYLNGKRNGKGKEYYKDKNENDYLLYEGEYLNGKRNGKGKEYHIYHKQLMYEGEYLCGKKWNGKGYDEEGNLIYELKNGKGYVKKYYNYDDNYEDFPEIFCEGEYLNGGLNGRVKEYLVSDNLIFEGEYLNGKRNGKGKEYRDGKLLFEGEYKNDKIWNGKGYDQNNNLLYEIQDGKGFVKEYDFYVDLLFEGEYVNGERNGKGKEFYKSYLIFEGEYSNGKRNGKGKEFYKSYLIFEGEYLYDKKRTGKAFINGRLEYEGEYLNDKKWNGKGYDEKGNLIYQLNNGNGQIKEYNYDTDNFGLKFEGEYLNGKRNGKGKEYYDDGQQLKFDGEYLNGKRNGKGKEYYYNGNLGFEGDYLNGKINGKGKEYYYNGKLKFEGEYLNNKKWNGKGYGGYNFYHDIIYELKDGKGFVKEYNEIGELEYEGEYVNGERNGKGREYYGGYEDILYEGEYKDGERHGKGKEYIGGKFVEGIYKYGNRISSI